MEINPVLEPPVHDDVDSESSMNTDRDRVNRRAQITNEQDEKLVAEIQNYEKRIQGLIEGIGMLKERVTPLNFQRYSIYPSICIFFLSQARTHLHPEQTDQLRADIDSSLRELERSQENTRSSRSLTPHRQNYRSASADELGNGRLTSKVSFENSSPIEKYVYLTGLLLLSFTNRQI